MTPSSGFPWALLPGVMVSPLVSAVLRNGAVGSMATRALLVGLAAAVITLVAAQLVKPTPFRSRLTPLVLGVVMALANVAVDWISLRH